MGFGIYSGLLVGLVQPSSPFQVMPVPNLTFLEFFAGAGMARIGLGSRWRCLLANDIDRSKAAAYRANFKPATELLVADVGSISTDVIPGHADMAWASFPCQDLSLAGNGAGLRGGRSGTFWPFWRLVSALKDQGRAPGPWEVSMRPPPPTVPATSQLS